MIKHPLLLATGLCASLCAPLSVSAQDNVFRSIGEDGTVEFSDRGDARSSKKFQISEPVVVQRLAEIPNPNGYKADQKLEPTTLARLPPTGTYEELQILSPADNGNGWIDGDVQVKLALTPRLKAGHEVVIKLDGTEVTSGTQLNHALPEVYRGMHTLQVSVRDITSGSTLASNTVDFQVHRRIDKTNTRLLHPSLQPKTVVNPSDINEILSN